MPEQPSDTGLEYLATNKADFGMAFGLSGKMLAPAKTDLEPNRTSRRTEGGTGFQPARLRNGQNKLWQQLADSDPLRRAKPPPAAAPENQPTLCQLHNRRRLEGAPQLVREIEPLPGEAAVGFGLSAEMTVGCCAGVNRFIQAKMRADAAW